MSNPISPGNRATDQKWIIKKEVSVGDLIAFSVAALAVVSAYYTIDKRLALLENAQQRQVTTDQTQDLARANIRVELRADLIRIETKVDYIMENVPHHK